MSESRAAAAVAKLAIAALAPAAKARKDAAEVRARVEAGELSAADAHWLLQTIKYEFLTRSSGAALDDVTSAALDLYRDRAHDSVDPAFKSPAPSSRPTAPPRGTKRGRDARGARCLHPLACHF